jgi:hypothetical protein
MLTNYLQSGVCVCVCVCVSVFLNELLEGSIWMMQGFSVGERAESSDLSESILCTNA